jgi:hypothetical protein
MISWPDQPVSLKKPTVIDRDEEIGRRKHGDLQDQINTTDLGVRHALSK